MYQRLVNSKHEELEMWVLFDWKIQKSEKIAMYSAQLNSYGRFLSSS